MSKKILKKQNGFTLLEVLIAMAIIALVGFLIVQFSGDLATSALRLNGSLFTQQEIRQTLQLMVPEIRTATQSNTGGYLISSAATTSLEFFTDLDNDGLIERIRYFVASSTLKKGVLKPAGDPPSYGSSTETVYDLVNGVVSGSQIFTYYDASATSTASAAMTFPIDVLNIRMIRITLAANQGTTSTPSIVGAEDQVLLRSFLNK